MVSAYHFSLLFAVKFHFYSVTLINVYYLTLLYLSRSVKYRKGVRSVGDFLTMTHTSCWDADSEQRLFDPTPTGFLVNAPDHIAPSSINSSSVGNAQCLSKWFTSSYTPLVIVHMDTDKFIRKCMLPLQDAMVYGIFDSAYHAAFIPLAPLPQI